MADNGFVIETDNNGWATGIPVLQKVEYINSQVMGLIPRALYAALDENVCQIHNYKCKIEVYTEALKSALRFEYALIQSRMWCLDAP